mgnify:CR=1 FL=1
MQNLDEVVDFYLKSETNFALMITGDWGVGKTYYFKNVLKEKISNTSTYQNDSKKYRPILVSLFGINSIADIQTEILMSIYPILKNKNLKLGLNITKSLMKAILQFNNLGGEFDIMPEEENGRWIDFNELVICFDDLERLSDKFSIEEVIGFINSLVENGNVKILIIANENKINKDNYIILKEKVVGNSIEFIVTPNFNTSS